MIDIKAIYALLADRGHRYVAIFHDGQVKTFKDRKEFRAQLHANVEWLKTPHITFRIAEIAGAVIG